MKKNFAMRWFIPEAMKKFWLGQFYFGSFYEKLQKKDIWVITDTKDNLEKLKKFTNENFCYLPDNTEKYSFNRTKRYPNIYMKFCIYELKKFGYTHVIYMDSDMFVNFELAKKLSIIEKHIVTNVFGFGVGRYDRKIICKENGLPTIHIAGCIVANIEKDISDMFLSYDGKTPLRSADEDLIDEFAKEHLDELQDLPVGLVSQSDLLRDFTVFYHTGGLLWYSALASRKDKTDWNRYKELCEMIELEK